MAFFFALRGKSESKKANALAVIEDSYIEGTTDEFIKPTIIVDNSGNPLGTTFDGKKTWLTGPVIGRYPLRYEKEGCFIATACYGYDSEEVCILQQARDTYLVKNELGFALVRLYYTISPCIADIIRNNYLLKQIIRILLKPIVYALKRFL